MCLTFGRTRRWVRRRCCLCLSRNERFPALPHPDLSRRSPSHSKPTAERNGNIKPIATQHVPNTTKTRTELPSPRQNEPFFSLTRLCSFAFDMLGRTVLSVPFDISRYPRVDLPAPFPHDTDLPEPDTEALTSYQHCMLHRLHRNMNGPDILACATIASYRIVWHFA